MNKTSMLNPIGSIYKVWGSEPRVRSSVCHEVDLEGGMESKRAPPTIQYVGKLWQIEASLNWDSVGNMTVHTGVNLRGNVDVVNQ
jgi:hypothetical protein